MTYSGRILVLKAIIAVLKPNIRILQKFRATLTPSMGVTIVIIHNTQCSSHPMLEPRHSSKKAVFKCRICLVECWGAYKPRMESKDLG